MGGSVFMGIKRGDGSEHLWEMWTNSVPYWFARADFVDDGAGIDEFLAQREQVLVDKSGLYTRRHRSVTYSEYGVILIDFASTPKRILSCQGYTHAGRMILSGIDVDEAKAVLALQAHGRLGRVSYARGGPQYDRGLKPDVLDLLLADCAAVAAGAQCAHDWYVNVYTRLDDFDVYHSVSSPSDDRGLATRVRAFLENGWWRARVRGTRRRT